MAEYSTKNFRAVELRCKCDYCKGAAPHQMQTFVVDKLQQLRDKLKRSLTVTSGYRCPKHPEEAKKRTRGWHNRGYAVDIAISNGAEGYEIIKAALELGCTGFAIGNGFVHIDWRTSTPVVWKY